MFRLKGFDCKDNLQKIDLIDNQLVKTCDGTKFSTYDKAIASQFTILHKKTFKNIHVNTCKIKLTTNYARRLLSPEFYCLGDRNV